MFISAVIVDIFKKKIKGPELPSMGRNYPHSEGWLELLAAPYKWKYSILSWSES